MPGQTDLVLLRHAFAHIGIHSGYENFIMGLKDEHISYAEVQRTRSLQRFDLRRRMFYTRANKKKAGEIGAYYDVFSYIAEMDALRTVQSTGAKLLHNTHIEDNHGYLGAAKTKKAYALIATAHQPVSWWKFSGKNVAILQQLDQLIALNAGSADFFEQYIPGRVQLLQHGVDTDFFHVNKSIAERPLRILFVGNWLRDLAFLETVLDTVLKRDTEIMVDLVFPKSNDVNSPVFRLCRHPHVTMHHRISDEALCRLYNDSRLLFIPFIDATANNALLEAAACGLPMVTTGLAAVKEYSDASYSYYYKEAKDCTEYILQTIRDGTVLQQQSVTARKHAERFCIAKSAKAHATLYRQYL